MLRTRGKASKTPRKKPRSWHDFARYTLDETHDRFRPRRTLVLTGDPEALVGIGVYPVSSLFLVHVPARPGRVTPAPTLACRTDALPFQLDSFDMVVVHGLLGNGDEVLIGEIKRVMQSGGHLVVIGTGRWGSRNLGRSRPEDPALRPFRLCRRLRERSFVIERCSGYGLARTPIRCGRGLSKPLVGVSDQVMVRARLTNVRPIYTHVRFGRVQPLGAGLRSLAADGLLTLGDAGPRRAGGEARPSPSRRSGRQEGA